MDIVRLTRSLTPESVLEGYRQGMFPMGYPNRGFVSWHRPPNRAIVPLGEIHISRSLARTLRKADFEVTVDRAFADVMRGCADRDSTWITPEIFRVYNILHRGGWAHSLEVWRGERLVGGVYGVHVAGAFFAESKFHRETDMSKVALVKLEERLRERRFALLEVQYLTGHLSQFGVIEIPHRRYMELLQEALERKCSFT